MPASALLTFAFFTVLKGKKQTWKQITVEDAMIPSDPQ